MRWVGVRIAKGTRVWRRASWRAMGGFGGVEVSEELLLVGVGSATRGW